MLNDPSAATEKGSSFLEPVSGEMTSTESFPPGTACPVMVTPPASNACESMRRSPRSLRISMAGVVLAKVPVPSWAAASATSRPWSSRSRPSADNSPGLLFDRLSFSERSNCSSVSEMRPLFRESTPDSLARARPYSSPLLSSVLLPDMNCGELVAVGRSVIDTPFKPNAAATCWLAAMTEAACGGALLSVAPAIRAASSVRGVIATSKKALSPTFRYLGLAGSMTSTARRSMPSERISRETSSSKLGALPLRSIALNMIGPE